MGMSTKQSTCRWFVLAILCASAAPGYAESCDPWKPMPSDTAGLMVARADAERCKVDLDRRLAEIRRRLGQANGAPEATKPQSALGVSTPMTGTVAPAVPAKSAYVAPSNGANSLPSGKTCYTGPRGGTYTITSSGKKNYGGC